MGGEYNKQEQQVAAFQERLKKQSTFVEKVNFLDGVISRRQNPDFITTLANRLSTEMWAAATEEEMDDWARYRQAYLRSTVQDDFDDFAVEARASQLKAKSRLQEEK